MNSFLADAIGTINAVIAVAIIGVSAVVTVQSDNPLFLFGGVCAASLLCGVVALVVDMRKELKMLNKQLARAIANSAE